MANRWNPEAPRPARVQRRDDNMFVMDEVHGGVGPITMRRYFELCFKWPLECEIWDIPVGATEGPHVHDEVDPDGYVMIDECYIVLDGQGRFLLDDQEVDLAPGDAMFIDPRTSRGIVNTGDSTLRILLLSDLPVQAMPEVPGA